MLSHIDFGESLLWLQYLEILERSVLLTSNYLLVLMLGRSYFLKETKHTPQALSLLISTQHRETQRQEVGRHASRDMLF